jgi:hypothetical protein
MNWLDDIGPWLSLAVIGGVGGAINQLYQHATKARPLSWKMLTINFIVSAFVAHLFGALIPEAFNEYRSTIGGAVGFVSYPLLQIVEARGAGFLVKMAERK